MSRPLAPNDVNALPRPREDSNPIRKWVPTTTTTTQSPQPDPFAVHIGTPRYFVDGSAADDPQSLYSSGTSNRMIVPLNLPRMLARHQDRMTNDRLIFLDSRLHSSCLEDELANLTRKTKLLVIFTTVLGC